MLSSLELDNFRSIRSCKCDLGDFVVLIGSNGSGKSNFVKAVELVSAIARGELSQNIDRAGGFLETLPKALSEREAKKSTMRIKYTAVVRQPGDETGHQDQTAVHEINLKKGRASNYTVASESLLFSQEQPLPNTPHDSHASSARELLLRVARRNHRTQFKFEPRPTLHDFAGHVRWLGFDFLADEPYGLVREVLKKLLSDAQRVEPLESVLSGTAMQLYFAPIVKAIRGTLAGIRRFDFQLFELRREQDGDASGRLASDGRYLPSVLKHLKANGNTSSWNELLTALQEIAPHVVSAGTERLANGRQFVEFTEKMFARKVNSWDSSDGTLRALAIMLALETHPENSTILLEEPEQNLHPWALPPLLEFMRDVMRRRELQIICTTHSAEVLKLVNPGEVLVADRTPELGTRIRSLDEIAPGNSIDMGDVGRMWLRGLLSGVPAP